MGPNPYRWHQDQPGHVVPRPGFLAEIEAYLHRGAAVKLVGGRGMGKSVALRQIRDRLSVTKETSVVLIPVPPAVDTHLGCLEDLVRRLKLTSVEALTLDGIMEAAERAGTTRIVLLLDEIDQFLIDGRGSLAVRWLNLLEATRKSWMDRFAVMIAGGLGTLHLGHVLGSGLLSRAETVISAPFSLDELRVLAEPLTQRGTPLGDAELEILAALSGGNPALATYALGELWGREGAAGLALQDIFAEFPARHRDFLESVKSGVSHRGLVGAPGRVLEKIRAGSGPVQQAVLRAACDGDEPPVDVVQALQILEAAGLVRVSGSRLADPVVAHAVASILNVTQVAAIGANPVERLLRDISGALGQFHRFGRDFHGKDGLLLEDTFSAFLAVVLAMLGWTGIRREMVQAAGYVDLHLQIAQSGMNGHVVLETKIWPRNGYEKIQDQIHDYWVSDTMWGVAVVLGSRGVATWSEDYEAACLAGRNFTRQTTSQDLVAHWRVEEIDAHGNPRTSDHFLVQIPKRS